jgi:hypothetical protein
MRERRPFYFIPSRRRVQIASIVGSIDNPGFGGVRSQGRWRGVADGLVVTVGRSSPQGQVTGQ